MPIFGISPYNNKNHWAIKRRYCEINCHLIFFVYETFGTSLKIVYCGLAEYVYECKPICYFKWPLNDINNALEFIMIIIIYNNMCNNVYIYEKYEKLTFLRFFVHNFWCNAENIWWVFNFTQQTTFCWWRKSACFSLFGIFCLGMLLF